MSAIKGLCEEFDDLGRKIRMLEYLVGGQCRITRNNTGIYVADLELEVREAITRAMSRELTLARVRLQKLSAKLDAINELLSQGE